MFPPAGGGAIVALHGPADALVEPGPGPGAELEDVTCTWSVGERFMFSLDAVALPLTSCRAFSSAARMAFISTLGNIYSALEHKGS